MCVETPRYQGMGAFEVVDMKSNQVLYTKLGSS